MKLRVTNNTAKYDRTMILDAEQLHKVFAHWGIAINFMHYGLLVAALDDNDMWTVRDILREYELSVEIVDLLDMSEFESELSDTDIPKILSLF